MLTTRQQLLLQLLESEYRHRTVNYLAKQIGVSVRTVHTDLKMIEGYLKKQERYLEKKRGVGVLLRAHATFEPKSNIVEDSQNSLLNRRVHLIRQLLFEEAIVSFNQLADQNFISSTSIKKDFEFVIKILAKQSHLSLLHSKKGSFLEGEERDFIKAHVNFNQFLYESSERQQESLSDSYLANLEKFYGSDLVILSKQLIYTYIRENANIIAEAYIQNLFHHFLAQLYRISKGYHINETLSKDIPTNQFYIDSAVRLMHKASVRLKFSYENADVHYLSQQLLLNRFELIPYTADDEVFVDWFIENLSELMHIDFTQDNRLRESLVHHIPAMNLRIQSQTQVVNPFVQQIKLEFTLLFNMVYLIMNRVFPEKQQSVSEDEVAFITMYFQVALERSKQNKRYIIACPTGIATSELLINRIKRLVPNLDTFEVLSLTELEEVDLTKFDMMISTVNYETDQIPVVVVNPFASDEVLRKILDEQIDSNHSESESSNKLGYIHLLKWIGMKQIHLNQEMSDRYQVLQSICEQMTKEKLVVEGYYQSLVEREQISSTDLPVGVAIPHGKPELVKKTTIQLIQLNRKLKWESYFVDLIFLISIAPQDLSQAKSILSEIYNLMSNESALDFIRNVQEPNEVIRYLGGE